MLVQANSGSGGDTGWQAVGTSGLEQYLKYRIKNGFCTLAYWAQSSQSYVAGYTNITTNLPQAARPSTRIGGAAYVGNVGSVVIYESSSASAGTVSILCASAVSSAGAFCITYPV